MRRWLPVLILATCAAGPKRRPVEPPPPVEIPTPTPPAAPATPPPRGPMWTGLPVDGGPLPAGIAHPGAAACEACHAPVVAAWRTSGHARAAARVDAIVGDGCDVCHLPTRSQHEPQLDLAAWADGVGCAACHLRDGAVVAARPSDAPHATAWSPELAGPGACATCHQLSWPGASVPLYDTVGEWERSGWASAGVGCVDCHGAHDVARPFGQAVSVLPEAATRTIVRGGAALPFAVVLQNTGAGHAMPTGSPYAGLRVELALVGPVGKKGEPGVRGAPATLDLARTVSDAAPWVVTEDRRLAPGASRRLEASFALPADAALGPWSARIRVLATSRGVPGAVRYETSIPLTVK